MPNGGMDNCSTCWLNQANEDTNLPWDSNPDGVHRCMIPNFDIYYYY